MRLRDPRIPSSLAVVAAAVWIGGLLVLGALVAPIVFTMIPAPGAADAMTVVFSRFDTVALACVMTIVAAEAWRSAIRTEASIGKLDVARMAAGTLGAALVLLEALWISPAIVALHRGGAIRGLGPEGLDLDRIHGYAEACGKAQVIVGLALIVLHVFTVERAKGRRAPREAAIDEEETPA